MTTHHSNEVDWLEYERSKRALPELCADDYERAIARIVRQMEKVDMANGVNP